MKLLLAILGYFLVVAYAMDCNFGTSKDILDEFINSCPRPLIDNKEAEYCCINSDGEVHCCDIFKFIFTWMIAFLPIIIIVIFVSFLASCICCLCCPCCLCYRG